MDGLALDLPAGENLLDALRAAGKDIPSMCYLKGLPHFSACMMCVVKVGPQQRLRPSCSLKVEQGMEVLTRDKEIEGARKTALELLLSEHVGDCEAPCQLSCPAHMDIPLMNRYLAAGAFNKAYQVVMKDIALPAVLGRICPAPCEGACRRKDADQPVSICLLKRFAGDKALENAIDKDATMELTPDPEPRSARVVVIGAGPAGLAAAFHLAGKGYRVSLYDSHEKPGGSLLKVDKEELPPQVLEAETARILNAGVEFIGGEKLDTARLAELQKDFKAVVLATGRDSLGNFGELEASGVDKNSYQYRDQGLFVVGSALRHARMAIRALGQGKEAAFSVDQYLQGKELQGEPRRFNSRFGRLHESEVVEYLKEASADNRQEAAGKEQGSGQGPDAGSGLDEEQVRREAARCMHCDCRDMEQCQLRTLSEIYGAGQRRYRSEQRARVSKNLQHDKLVFEESKCIRCGLCVRLCEQQEERLGLAFIGRGFELRVAVPFDKDMEAAIGVLADKVAINCPTGALTLK